MLTRHKLVFLETPLIMKAQCKLEHCYVLLTRSKTPEASHHGGAVNQIVSVPVPHFKYLWNPTLLLQSNSHDIAKAKPWDVDHLDEVGVATAQGVGGRRRRGEREVGGGLCKHGVDYWRPVRIWAVLLLVLSLVALRHGRVTGHRSGNRR